MVRSGGVYCEKCNKCLTYPRKRKNWQPISYIICDECDFDVTEVNFCPNENSIKTNFKVRNDDLHELIYYLVSVYNKSRDKQ